MIEHHRAELRNIFDLYGIHGIIAVMAEWAEREGGLSFVQIVVAGLNQLKLAEARRRMEEIARTA
jgi:hypothetical protein